MRPAGRRNRRIAFEEGTRPWTRESGAMTYDPWVPYFTLWAEREDLAGTELFRAQQLAAKVTTRYRIPYPHGKDVTPRESLRIVDQRRVMTSPTWPSGHAGRAGLEILAFARAEQDAGRRMIAAEWSGVETPWRPSAAWASSPRPQVLEAALRTVGEPMAEEMRRSLPRRTRADRRGHPARGARDERARRGDAARSAPARGKGGRAYIVRFLEFGTAGSPPGRSCARCGTRTGRGSPTTSRPRCGPPTSAWCGASRASPEARGSQVIEDAVIARAQGERRGDAARGGGIRTPPLPADHEPDGAAPPDHGPARSRAASAHPGRTGHGTIRLQVDCWAKDYRDARELAREVRQRLNGFPRVGQVGCRSGEALQLVRDRRQRTADYDSDGAAAPRDRRLPQWRPPATAA